MIDLTVSDTTGVIEVKSLRKGEILKMEFPKGTPLETCINTFKQKLNEYRINENGINQCD